jgi:hypothetical protein
MPKDWLQTSISRSSAFSVFERVCDLKSERHTDAGLRPSPSALRNSREGRRWCSVGDRSQFRMYHEMLVQIRGSDPDFFTRLIYEGVRGHICRPRRPEVLR